MPTERPRLASAAPGGVPKAVPGGVLSEAACHVLGAAGNVRNFVGGSDSAALGAERLLGSMSTTSSSGDASRARHAARIEVERAFFMISDGERERAEG